MRSFAVDRGSPLPIIRQIYHELSAQILRGDLVAGERLPSTREAASELGVSRNVVIEAYDQLAAEGYVLPVEGGGTYVAEGSFLGPPPAGPARPEGGGGPLAPQPAAADFDSGRPALDLVPLRRLARMELEARLGGAADALGYAPPEGRIELRRALRGYLLRKRGIDCDPEQIVVTSGALQGVALVARAVLRGGGLAAVEDPGTVSVRDLLRLEGAELAPVPADEEGLKVELLPRGRPAGLVFVTPSHQFPLGGCLSVQRRVALVGYARETGCAVVEDDYESEFRYDGPPVSSLQRLDPERVAYVGTFSKILFPALRLGYAVVPLSLVGACREAKRASDRFSPPSTQLAVARFIEEGLLDRHVARMKREYRRRRDALVRSLESAFPGRVRIVGGGTGMHLVAVFEGIEFDGARLGVVAREGIRVRTVEEYAIEKGRHRNELVLGYSHLRPEEIERGVRALARALSSRA